METDFPPVRSAIGGMVWPGLPAGTGSLLLAMQFQLEQTQWWSPEQLWQYQSRQLGLLLEHAYGTMQFWRDRLSASGYEPGSIVTRDWMRSLPLLARREVQQFPERLINRNPPTSHGPISQGQTSGSTGMPVICHQTAVSGVFWDALTVRDHLWHQRNLGGKLAVVRASVEDCVLEGWGPPADAAFVTGPCAVLNIGRDVDAQLDWLHKHDPHYLLTYPSNLLALARRALERKVRLGRLKEIRTLGEMLPHDLRHWSHDAWGVPVTDMYSAVEVGYIALQCPQHQHYHAQAESLIVEVLDENGTPCVPGQIGRVVLTTLHNFAMPLIRYEIGDYAEVGSPCPCGRGLPAIRRVLGRSRNILTLPDGRQRWPSFPSQKWAHVALIRQLQMVQKTRESIDVRIVPERTLTACEKDDLIASLQNCLGHSFKMTVIEVAEISRQGSYKFEDFISEIA